jgi:hypothetical protein
MPNEWQVGDPTLLASLGAGESLSAPSSGGYGYGVNLSYGANYGGATLETIAPQSNGQLSGTGGEQNADFNLYLKYAERVIGLINPFTAQYASEQSIRLTQEQTALQNAKNAGQYVPPKQQDMTLVYVLGGVVVIGALVFAFEKKG